MLTSIVVSIVRACTRFAWPTLIVGLVLSVAGGYYTARHFVINTDINTLISENLDWRQRDQQFDRAFERDSTILAVVEAPTTTWHPMERNRRITSPGPNQGRLRGS